MAHQSIYRSLCRSPRSDVYHVAEHIVRPETGAQLASASTEPDWADRRKAMPPETLLPATLRRMASLPSRIELRTLSTLFPRIVNAICALWDTPDELAAYVDDLLIDKRGGRRGFPPAVLNEIQALNTYLLARLAIADAWERDRDLLN